MMVQKLQSLIRDKKSDLLINLSMTQSPNNTIPSSSPFLPITHLQVRNIGNIYIEVDLGIIT